MILGHMFTYTDLRSGEKIIQTLFLFFWSEHCFGSVHTWCWEPLLSSVHGLLMRDGTVLSGKIYILKWIKVIAVLKPASEAQINLSSVCGCVGVWWVTLNEMVWAHWSAWRKVNGRCQWEGRRGLLQSHVLWLTWPNLGGCVRCQQSAAP